MSHSSQLDIEQDMPFQQKTWVLQRRAWIALLVILLAGLLGLFGGSGLLAQASASGANDAIQVDYKRFTQYLSPTDFKITVRLPQDTGDTLRLWIDRQYLDGFIIQYITPQPDRVEAASDRLVYEFPLAESEGTITITWNVRHHHVGTLSGRMGLEGGQTLEFSQFVYP